MGAVTYPNPEVEQFLAAHFIPVQFNVVEQPEVMELFNTPWTPTLIVLDDDGKEHRRSQGYLDPQRFLAEMSMARLQAAIDRQDFTDAPALADEARRLTAGDAEREPEALYWSSVANYKATSDSGKLLQGWNQLLDQFPQSDWAKKAEFIRY
jgi:phosphoserine aminotransferase